jgi:hypothetical protein
MVGWAPLIQGFRERGKKTGATIDGKSRLMDYKNWPGQTKIYRRKLRIVLRMWDAFGRHVMLAIKLLVTF